MFWRKQESIPYLLARLMWATVMNVTIRNERLIELMSVC